MAPHLLRSVPTLAGAAVTAYAAVVRPRLLRWGATPTDVRRPLPGDDLVPRPRYVATRGVTIEAAPAEVWPWLAQMGQGRGGLYSYDRLENLMGCDIHSADRVVPELQHLAVGDVVRLVPADTDVPLALDVAVVEPGHALVLRTPDPSAGAPAGLPTASWAFVVEPAGRGRSRLVVRWRSDYRPTLKGRLVNQYLLEPVHFLMERRMLLGIRARAERLAAEHRDEARERSGVAA